MKILMVNAVDAHGGAARSAYRLHSGLLKAGVDSQMLVNQKSRDNETVLASAGALQRLVYKLRPALDKLPLQFYKNRVPTHFSPALLPWSGLADRINRLNADIVHLHWVCDAMLHVGDLAKIRAPIVWTFHDNWAFTGGCHVKWTCDRYLRQCGRCPLLASTSERDLSHQIFVRKQKAFARKKDLVLVGPSRWMADCARTSSMFSGRRVVNIPNPLDTARYAPFDKQAARALLQLAGERKFVLFGAVGGATDFNKGFSLLLQSLRLLQSHNVELLVFGSDGSSTVESLGLVCHFFGHLHDDISLRLLYCAADVVVVPSREENLSNVIMESLACATPVVAFDVGGNADLVEHRRTGYLVRPFEVDDMACGINWVLQAADSDELAHRAREKVIQEFDTERVVAQYMSLYLEVMQTAGGA